MGITGWIVLILAIVVLLVLGLTVRKIKRVKRISPTPPSPPPVEHKQPPASGNTLSEVELACLKTLKEVAGTEFEIKSRVLLSDVVRQHLQKRIPTEQSDATRRVNFILFHRKDGSAAAAIRLCNPDDTRLDKQKQLLLKSGIRVFDLRRKSSYSIVKMRDLLKPLLKKAPPTPDEMASTISMHAYRFCKRCQTRMELKRADSGSHKGTLFWVCGRYPECRSVELYID